MSANAPLMDDDTPEFGEELTEKGKLKHPFVTLFHLLFRFGAIVFYVICGYLTNSFITSFVIVVLLLSADFWTVKNITGRLMVGLRWWNYVDDEGKSHWVYESRKGVQQSRINATESRLFWSALYASPVIWVVLLIVALFRFNFTWMILPLIGIALNGANVYGYLRCRYSSAGGLSTSLGAATSSLLQKQLLNNITGFMFRSQAANASSQPQQTV